MTTHINTEYLRDKLSDNEIKSDPNVVTYYNNMMELAKRIEKASNKPMQETKFTPSGTRILVEPIAPEMKQGLIIIPDVVNKQETMAEAIASGRKIPMQKPVRGTVVAVGPGKKDEPITVKVGDKIIYGEFTGASLKSLGCEENGHLIIMDTTDAWGTFE